MTPTSTLGWRETMWSKVSCLRAEHIYTPWVERDNVEYLYLIQQKLLWQLVIGNWALGIFWAYKNNAKLLLE